MARIPKHVPRTLEEALARGFKPVSKAKKASLTGPIGNLADCAEPGSKGQVCAYGKCQPDGMMEIYVCDGAGGCNFAYRGPCKPQ